MFEKLMSQMQNQTEEAKQKLDNIRIKAEAEGGLIKITATGNRLIKDIEISDKIVGDKEALEDLMMVAINRVLKKIEKVQKNEMGAVANNLMPGMGSLSNIFGK